MKKLLVSACLVGDKVRYDGKGKFVPEVFDLKDHFDLLLCCPEFDAIKKAPRPKMELLKGSLFDEKGKDHTLAVLNSCENVVRLCRHLGVRYALLKSNSPSCGNEEIYDGTFSGKLVAGEGILTKELKKIGITVYNETQIRQLLLDTKIIRVKDGEDIISK